MAAMRTERASLAARVREFFWGLFLFDLWRETRELQRKQEDALLALVYGELLGLPLLRSPYALHLLPHTLPKLGEWKKRQLAERDVIQHAPDCH